jgi:hypothetical protein
VKSGAPAFSIPASDESIHCWATGKSTNGTAIQTMPKSAIAGQAERGTAPRAAGIVANVATPKASRSNATSSGRKWSTPTSMKRNDEPHSPATDASKTQSTAVNAPARISDVTAYARWVRESGISAEARLQLVCMTDPVLALWT